MFKKLVRKYLLEGRNEEIDFLLDKIHNSGIKSLTPLELEILRRPFKEKDYAGLTSAHRELLEMAEDIEIIFLSDYAITTFDGEELEEQYFKANENIGEHLYLIKENEIEPDDNNYVIQFQNGELGYFPREGLNINFKFIFNR